MDTLYVLLGSSIGILILILYLKHLSSKNTTLSQRNKVLEAKVKYQQEMLDELLTPTTIDDTIDSLLKGDF